MRRKRHKHPWKRWLRYLHLRFVRLRGTPDEISRGFAFGVFWGMFPLPGLQMAIAILTAALLRSSKMAAAAGTWLSNPITTLPLTAFNFHVGQTILRREWTELSTDDLRSLDGFLDLGSEFLTSYLLGCFVVGLAFSIISYFIGIPLISHWQKRILQRQMHRKRIGVRGLTTPGNRSR